MITVAKKGSRTRGLVEYLFGPGRHEEHTNQRIVAAWDVGWEGITHPDEVQRALLTAELDRPIATLESLSGERAPAQHVYHVSISNHGEDRNLSDAEWSLVAHAVAEKLGFTETDTRAGVRWIAVHHGAASGDRDHIHIQATLVREDGRAVRLQSDRRALREVATEMRERFGLEVRTREVGAGTPPLSRVEVQRQVQTREESVREELRRTVRACATAARTESEFVAMATEHRVVLRPRWDTGTGRTTVVGYSAARPTSPTSGQDLVWFGGGKLGKDLTLPALRAGWAQDPSAVPAWRSVDDPRHTTAGPATTGTGRRRPELTTGGDTQEVAAARAVHEVREALRAVPVGDGRAWSAAARDGAGVLAAAAQALEGRPAVSVSLAAHALAEAVDKQPGRHVPPAVGEGRLGSAARAMLTVIGASADGVGTAVLLTQVLRLSESIAEAHAQAGRLALARAAALSAERNVTALALVGGPRELGPVPNPAMAWAMEQARRAARTPITRPLASPNQAAPPVRGRPTRDLDRGM
ncbi:relaxase/mobilization nuclease domain-containing protein (plasmid) [Rhodococcus antarcticus]|uniref:Relaxase/mobilization nuclease domain-containing protein n=1 Tax=Rhodococcus antarcticus TaxID=2987751 RepID=A0ABY6P5V8_9NOCA|nr:hypothetical protein [Rhodococcus antarcticus]UZJ27059.1 relaxase/mobilization nuclease domain-containing protein [Rhodococcus antarcticus]